MVLAEFLAVLEAAGRAFDRGWGVAYPPPHDATPVVRRRAAHARARSRAARCPPVAEAPGRVVGAGRDRFRRARKSRTPRSAASTRRRGISIRRSRPKPRAASGSPARRCRTGAASTRGRPTRGSPSIPICRRASLTTARLTPEYQARLEKRVADVKRGIEWDPISTCAPPGHPRWLTEPFLREFVPTPDQTWLINEMVNDIRRVYTDGRDHVPAEDRYPLYNGDSIGFWDGGRPGRPHQPAAGRHLPALQSGLHRPGRDGRDLAARGRHHHRRRLGLRSAGARRAVVRQAGLREARPETGPPHPLLELRRELRTTRCTRRRTARRSSTASPSTRRRRSERGHAQTAGAGGRGSAARP